MPNFTPNANLEKPTGNEFYLIPKFNANMDKIDVKLGDLTYADRITYIAEKIRNKNLLKNGDFNDGTTGWSAVLSSIGVSNNELTILASAINGRINQQITHPINNYLYRIALVKSTSNLVGLGNGAVRYANHSGSGNYEILSTLYFHTGANSYFSISDGRTSNWDNIYVKSLVSINITQIFGSGNEPTKAEVDAAIELLGGWTDVPLADKYAPKSNPTFSGTQNLPNIVTNGIKFPSVQVQSADPNTLDDYEEGTFTPVIIGSTTAGVGTYGSRVASYTKNGDSVSFGLYINMSAHTGTGNLQISGLPFLPLASLEVLHVQATNLALSANNIPSAQMLVGVGIEIRQQFVGGGGVVSNVPLDTSFAIWVSGTYKTA